MKNNKMKLIVFLLIFALLIGIVMAVSKDSKKIITRDTGSFVQEDFNSNYGVITLTNLSSKVSEYSLTYNTADCLTDCYATGKATLYTSGKLFDGVIFKNGEGQVVNINAQYLIKVSEAYVVNVPTYKQVCKKIKKNSTSDKTNECHQEISYSNQTKYRYVWNNYTGTILPAGNYYWKIQGKKSVSQNIDFIPVISGQQFTDWAWWNTSWSAKREFNFTNTLDLNLTGETKQFRQVWVNGTNFGIANCSKEIRVLKDDTTEVPRDILYSDEANNKCLVGFMIDTPKGTSVASYYVYYNSSVADVPTYLIVNVSSSAIQNGVLSGSFMGSNPKGLDNIARIGDTSTGADIGNIAFPCIQTTSNGLLFCGTYWTSATPTETNIQGYARSVRNLYSSGNYNVTYTFYYGTNYFDVETTGFGSNYYWRDYNYNGRNNTNLVDEVSRTVAYQLNPPATNSVTFAAPISNTENTIYMTENDSSSYAATYYLGTYFYTEDSYRWMAGMNYAQNTFTVLGGAPIFKGRTVLDNPTVSGQVFSSTWVHNNWLSWKGNPLTFTVGNEEFIGPTTGLTIVNSIPANGSNSVVNTINFACNATSTGTTNITGILLNVTGTTAWTQEVTGLDTQNYNATFTNSTTLNGAYTWNCLGYGTDTNGSSAIWSFNQQVSPTSPSVYLPTNKTYSGIVPINYTESFTNGGTINNYNITLWNKDATFNRTINAYNGLNLNYSWYSSAISGIFYVEVRVNDSLNLQSVGNSSLFSLDNTKPLISFISPTPNNDTNSSVNHFTAKVNVTESSPFNVTFVLTNSTNLINQTTFFPETHIINNTGTDASGFIGEGMCQSFQTGYSHINLIGFKLADSLSVASNYNFTLYETVVGNEFANFTAPITSGIANVTTQKVYYVDLNKDINKEKKYAICIVSVQNSPEIYLNNSNNYNSGNFSSFDTGTWTVSNGDLAFSIDGTMSANESINFTNLNDGTYFYNATATDWYQNSNSTETRRILIDTIAPEIQILYPTNITYVTGPNAINFSVYDLHLLSCLYSTNNGVTNVSNPTCANITGLTSNLGYNTWMVGANDTAGNINTSSVTFYIQTSANFNITLNNGTKLVWLPINNTQKNVNAFGQNSTKSVLIGSNDLNISISVLGSVNYTNETIIIKCWDTGNYSLAVNLTTSNSTISSLKAQNETINIWCWADYFNATRKYQPRFSFIGTG